MHSLATLLQHRHNVNASQGQEPHTNPAPRYLWIDCVDNHFSVHHMLGISADDTIIYRNLAHQVNYADLNCLSVLQYAIQIAGIQHIIVCGHYDCSLLPLAIQHTSADLVENWLSTIQVVAQKYEAWLGVYPAGTLRLQKLCELNVIEQVLRLCQTSVVQEAWKHNQKLSVHGWVYGHDGRLNNLEIDIADEQEIVPTYHAAIWKSIG